MHAQNREIVSPPDGGRILNGRWAPNGQHAVWSAVEVRNGQPPIWRVAMSTPDGTEERTLLRTEGGDIFDSPVWAPDGQSLYAVHRRTPLSAIERIRVGDTQGTSVFDGVDEGATFDISPDGNWLAVARNSTDGPSLAIGDLRTGAQRELVGIGVYSYLMSPRFDRQSARVTFSGALVPTLARTPEPDLLSTLAAFLDPVAEAHGLPQDLWTVPVEGGQPQALISVAYDDPVMTWSPDARFVAISSAEGVSVRDLNGGEPAWLLPRGDSGTIDWAD